MAGWPDRRVMLNISSSSAALSLRWARVMGICSRMTSRFLRTESFLKMELSWGR